MNLHSIICAFLITCAFLIICVYLIMWLMDNLSIQSSFNHVCYFNHICFILITCVILNTYDLLWPDMIECNQIWLNVIMHIIIRSNGRRDHLYIQHIYRLLGNIFAEHIKGGGVGGAAGGRQQLFHVFVRLWMTRTNMTVGLDIYSHWRNAWLISLLHYTDTTIK